MYECSLLWEGTLFGVAAISIFGQPVGVPFCGGFVWVPLVVIRILRRGRRVGGLPYHTPIGARLCRELAQNSAFRSPQRQEA